ncbi:MAG: TonB family protein [Paludibacteraceae bacterium]
MQQHKSHIIAACGTLLLMLLLFLLLWFVYIGAPVVEEDEGIEVAFGEVPEAGGYEAVPSEAVPLPAETASAPASTAPSDNDLLTQEDEESLALRKQREDAEKAKRQAEEERLRRAKEEADRVEAERIAREKALAEQRAKEQEAIAKANALGSLFGNNASGAQGSGDSKGEGQKGNPVAGHGSVGGTAWSLAGRTNKQLPKPANTFTQEGKVVVSIRVDAAGNVTDARMTGGTISDQATIQLAVEAARRAKFSESDQQVQMGTITYTFKFN